MVLTKDEVVDIAKRDDIRAAKRRLLCEEDLVWIADIVFYLNYKLECGARVLDLLLDEIENREPRMLLRVGIRHGVRVIKAQIEHRYDKMFNAISAAMNGDKIDLEAEILRLLPRFWRNIAAIMNTILTTW